MLNQLPGGLEWREPAVLRECGVAWGPQVLREIMEKDIGSPITPGWRVTRTDRFPSGSGPCV